MLDSLLGRAELKARIEELEAENRRLERRLDAENDRRSDAVTARQAAEERVNRLEDRVADLEGRLAAAAADRTDTLAPRRRERLRGDRLDEVLARLRSFRTGPEGALTAMVDGPVPEAVSDALGDRAPLVDRSDPALVCVDDAGLACVTLAPPLAPDPFVEWGEGFRLDPDWFRPTDGLSVALVRSDLFAIGRYDGGALVDRAAFQSDVKGAHSKGGFSQARFERRRDEQIAAHLDECRAVLDARDPDRLVLLGERTVLDELDYEAVAVGTVDATGAPETALEDAADSFFTTRLRVL